MKKLNPGDKAPDFSLLDQNGGTVRLADFKGEKILLYFYPKANTPGCTKQSCSVRDSLPDLSRLGIKSIGISPDNESAQKKFDDKYNLSFPLLADVDHKTAEDYGAWGEKSMYGKKYMGIIRSSFLIGEDGIIMKSWYKVKPLDTVPNVMEAVENV
jgi:peroxiredoxin Q/BCP